MSDAVHGRPPGARSESNLSAAAPSHAERARTIGALARTGTLATVARDPAGYPYASLVTFALEASAPVFLISELAEHTRNLRADPRASLLIAEDRPGDPLANGRVTLLGCCAPVSELHAARAREAYLERWPEAAGYADFADFAFWTLAVSSVRYIGGYGRMSWIDAEDWQRAEPDPIAPLAAGILEHMNQDHADALPLYCRAFAAVGEGGEVQSARMISIDRLGFEMSVRGAQGTRSVRLAFPQPIASSEDARQALIGLLRAARTKLASG